MSNMSDLTRLNIDEVRNMGTTQLIELKAVYFKNSTCRMCTILIFFRFVDLFMVKLTLR